MLDQLTELLFSEDDSNFDLAMTLAKGLDISSWQLYLDLKKCNEFFAKHWGIGIDLKVFLKTFRERQFKLRNSDRFDYFPDYLSVLAPLVKEVHLSIAKLTSVPACVYNYHLMSILNISNTLISELNNAIWDLGNLQELNLIGTNVYKIEAGISRAKQLAELKILTQYYAHLPDELAETKKLDTLWWGTTSTKVSSFKGIPQVIYECTGLKNLLLTGEKIEQLDNKIGQLKQLRKLVLHNTSTRELPEQLADLPHLEHIGILENDAFGKIPNVLKVLPNLKVLLLQCTRFANQSTFLEQLKGLEKLEKLSLPRHSFFMNALPQIQYLLPNTEIRFLNGF
jgi:hypothetical protein